MSRTDRETDELRNGTALRRMLQPKAPPEVQLEPASTYEAITRQMVIDLRSEIHSLRQRLDYLFSVVIGAIVLDLLLRLAGLN
ncbi:MAG TPA: hypothetical protein VHA53_00430 [Nitrolancea sp.]|jgi:hypothetical protein|nr:hypothetical protein [Nitrolancea sp.]